MHHRFAGAQRDLPERHCDAFGIERCLDQIMITDRSATGGDEDVDAAVARAPDCGGSGVEGVADGAEIDRVGAFRTRQCLQCIGVG